MNNFMDILSIIGYVLRALGFLVLGFAIGRFIIDAYKQAVWQVQVALTIGFFGLLVGLTNFSSPGSMGMFAIGAGLAMIMVIMTKKEDEKEEEIKSSKKK
ncbi:MAG: hypothetical protein MUO77_03670 [Anaerolineales bacterium]|nr:hypothetical protein [Anaerolineales bacterium]